MSTTAAVPQFQSPTVSLKPPRIAIVLVAVLILLVLIGGVFQFLLLPRWNAPSFKTPYQAVLLNGGAIYFGKLSRTWSDYPVLSDVYYLQSVTNKDNNQTSNILVKRGKEWHGPDHMVLNARNIVLIEPVGENSKVAQLIAESKQQQ